MKRYTLIDNYRKKKFHYYSHEIKLFPWVMYLLGFGAGFISAFLWFT